MVIDWDGSGEDGVDFELDGPLWLCGVCMVSSCSGLGQLGVFVEGHLFGSFLSPHETRCSTQIVRQYIRKMECVFEKGCED